MLVLPSVWLLPLVLFRRLPLLLLNRSVLVLLPLSRSSRWAKSQSIVTGVDANAGGSSSQLVLLLLSPPSRRKRTAETREGDTMKRPVHVGKKNRVLRKNVNSWCLFIRGVVFLLFRVFSPLIIEPHMDREASGRRCCCCIPLGKSAANRTELCCAAAARQRVAPVQILGRFDWDPVHPLDLPTLMVLSHQPKGGCRSRGRVRQTTD